MVGITIKDILTITGGNTKVMIFSADKEYRYIRLWYGIVDDIHFPHVPYGYYDVEHMINEEAVGYPYPTDWIEKLFIKYRDWKYIREILANKSKEEVYDEIKIISDDDLIKKR